MAEFSLSEQLRLLSDPRPEEFNPDEEDRELLSGAKLSNNRTYEDQGIASHHIVNATRRNKRGVSSTAFSKTVSEAYENDVRYAGRPVSRREIFELEQYYGEFSLYVRVFILTTTTLYIHTCITTTLYIHIRTYVL